MHCKSTCYWDLEFASSAKTSEIITNNKNTCVFKSHGTTLDWKVRNYTGLRIFLCIPPTHSFFLPFVFPSFFFFSQSFNIFLKGHGRNTQLRYYIILGFCYLWLWPSIFVEKKKNWTRFLESTFTLENNTQCEICIYPLVLASCLWGYLWWCS